jgi:predicted DsbA family dithiol-disulfide isomerase
MALRSAPALVREQATEAAKLGVSGTPTFLIGRADDQGHVTGTVVIGAQPFAIFESEVQKIQKSE